VSFRQMAGSMVSHAFRQAMHRIREAFETSGDLRT